MVNLWKSYYSRFFNKRIHMTVTLFEGDNQVDTPYGRGNLWYMTNYGFNCSTTYTVILNDSGSIVECQGPDIRHINNFTFGRGNKVELKKILTTHKHDHEI